MKVKSTKTIYFQKLNWGINAGAERELPEDKTAQEVILKHPAISEVGSSKSSTSLGTGEKDESKQVENKISTKKN